MLYINHIMKVSCVCGVWGGLLGGGGAGLGRGTSGTFVVFAVKSMKTTSGNFVNRRRSECRTQANAACREGG